MSSLSVVALRRPVPRAAAALAAALLAAALQLAATARGAAPADLAALARTTSCCAGPATFRYEQLAPGATREFAIDHRSPAFDFQSGRSFFHAFELPTTGGVYSVELQSFLDVPDASPRAARVFYPRIAVLTDDFIVSRSTDLDHLRFDLPVLERTTAPAYRLVVPLDAANPRERYLVVFTPAALLAARPLAITSPASAQRAAREAYLGASAVGRLRITVRPEPSGEAGARSPDSAARAQRIRRSE